MKSSLLITFLILGLSTYGQNDGKVYEKKQSRSNNILKTQEYGDIHEYLFKEKSFEGVLHGLTEIMHSFFIEDLGILNKKEIDVLKGTKVEISKHIEDPLSIVKVYEQEGILSFNEIFIIRLFNHSYLELYGIYPELDRKGIIEIYKNILWKIDPTQMPIYWGCIDTYSNKSLLANIDIEAMTIVFLNMLFIEMHELYHLCYDKNRTSLYSEMKADSFALAKVISYLNVEQMKDNSLITMLLSGGEVDELNGMEATFAGLLPILMTFDILEKTYDSKPHIFNKTTSDIHQRKVGFLKQVNKLLCVKSNSSNCNSLSKAIYREENEMPISFLKNKNYFFDIDNSDFTSNSNNNIPIDYFYKISMLLFDNELIKAESLLDLILEKKLKTFPVKIHETFYFVGAQLKQKIGKLNEAHALMAKAKTFSTIFSQKYYEGWFGMFVNKKNATALEEIRRYDQIFLDKFNEIQIDSSFSESEIEISYNYNLGKYNSKLEGYKKCSYSDKKKLKEVCIFYCRNLDYQLIYQGALLNNKPHGIGSLIYKMNIDSSIIVNYIISNFIEGVANEMTLVRVGGKKLTLLSNLESEIVIGLLDVWNAKGISNTYLPSTSVNLFQPNDKKILQTLADSVDRIFITNFGQLQLTFMELDSLIPNSPFSLKCLSNNDFINLYCSDNFLNLIKEMLDFISKNNSNIEFSKFWQEKKIIYDGNYIYEIALNSIFDCIMTN